MLAVLLIAGLLLGCSGLDVLPEPLRPDSRHQEYAKRLEQAGLTDSTLGRAWAAAADVALEQPINVELPLREALYFDPAEPSAHGYRFLLRPGQRLTVRLELPAETTAVGTTGERDAVDEQRRRRGVDSWFLDLFRVDSREDSGSDAAPNGTSERVVRLEEAEFDPSSGELRLQYEARQVGDHVVRLQAELLHGGRATLVARADGVLAFPVSGGGERDIGSRYGDPRDGGARRHEGVDIFAPRGTPAVAADAGRVSRVGTNRLGGNTVWMRTDGGLALYYAHLDSQSVRNGQRVEVGEEVGRVGNSGNARTTPPHLHFGVYRNGARDPSPFLSRSPEPAETGLPADALGVWRRTVGSTVNLRSGPGTRNAVSGRLEPHTAAWVEGLRAGWYRVRLGDGRVGYLAPSVTESTERPLRRAELSADAELLRHPQRGAARVARIPAGEEVIVLAESDNLELVRIPGGKIGWLGQASD